MKKLILITVLSIAFAITANQLINRYYLSDLTFYTKLSTTTDKWQKQLKKISGPQYVTAGGSSIKAGLNPQQLLDENNIKLVTTNLNAGMGVAIQLAHALPLLKAGDTLILGIEDENLINDNEIIPSSGLKMGLINLGLGMYTSSLSPPTWSNIRNALTGNTSSIAIATSRKLIPHLPPFRYEKYSHIHPSGWMEITLSAKQSKKSNDATKTQFHASNVELIKKIQKYEKKKSFKTIACFAPTYANESVLFLRAHLALQYLNLGIPVVKTANFSVYDRADFFADTHYHPNSKGAQHYTHALGQALQKQQYWTRDELLEELQKLSDKEQKN